MPYRRAEVASGRRKPPVRTTLGTKRRVYAAREGHAARFRLPRPFPLCTIQYREWANSRAAPRFTGPTPRCWDKYVLDETCTVVLGAHL